MAESDLITLESSRAAALAMWAALYLSRGCAFDVNEDVVAGIVDVVEADALSGEELVKLENLLRTREDWLVVELARGRGGGDANIERRALRRILEAVAASMRSRFSVRDIPVSGSRRGLHNCWCYEAWQAGYETVGDVADAGPGRIARAKGIGSVKLAACRRFMEDYGFWEGCDEA